jgi:hypothetical protein
MTKSITMTYIGVLEKRLKRKRDDYQTVEDTVESVTKNSVKQKYLELKAEIRELESCIDLAKVMFEDEN